MDGFVLLLLPPISLTNSLPFPLFDVSWQSLSLKPIMKLINWINDHVMNSFWKFGSGGHCRLLVFPSFLLLFCRSFKFGTIMKNSFCYRTFSVMHHFRASSQWGIWRQQYKRREGKFASLQKCLWVGGDRRCILSPMTKLTQNCLWVHSFEGWEIEESKQRFKVKKS